MSMLRVSNKTKHVTFVSGEAGDAGSCWDCHTFWKVDQQLLFGNARALQPFVQRHGLTEKNAIVMKPGQADTLVISVLRDPKVITASCVALAIRGEDLRCDTSSQTLCARCKVQ